MIPNDWKIMSLGEICSNHLQTGPFGSQLHSHEYVENGIPVLMPKDLNDYRADLSSAAKITPKKANDLKKHILKKGDLLFSRRGDVARFALIDEKSEGSICGTGCLKARPNENHSSKFLAYFLQKDSVKQWLEQNAVGQTMPNMNTEILRELPLISASSRKEEEKIAEILSTWDKAIETVEKLVANSQQQKKALMQQLLTGQKRLLDENGVKFGDEWAKGELGDLANIDSGYAFKSSDISDDLNGIPIIRMSDLKSGKLDLINSAKVSLNTISGLQKFKLNTGDFVFGMSGSLTNFAWIREKDLPCYLNQRVGRLVANSQANQLFVTYLYLSDRVQQSISDKAAGAAQLNISVNDLRKTQVFYPTIEEQEKIAQVLTLADREIDLYQQQLDKFKLEKKSLMQQLLTGQKRVRI